MDDDRAASAPDHRPHQPPRTSITDYRFSAGRAAATRQEKQGTARKPSKLPTSLSDLQDKMR